MYPVASRNDQDFHNLMDVYLDAVFYPNCLKNPQILMQEGWHYEMADENSPITYNGVVYNEMKGALSSPEALMEDSSRAILLYAGRIQVGIRRLSQPFLLGSLQNSTENSIIRPTVLFICMAIWILTPH